MIVLACAVFMAFRQPTQTPNKFVQTTENRQLIGSVDVVSKDGVIKGWALDPDVPKQQIDVRFYIDGPANQGVFIGAINANAPVDQQYGKLVYDGDHGFSFPIPAIYQGATEHTVFAYAIDASNDPTMNLLISNTGKKFVFQKGNALASPLPSPATFQLAKGEKAKLKAGTVIAGDVNINGEKAATSNTQTGTVVLLLENADVEAPWGATIIPSSDLETAKLAQARAALAVKEKGCGNGCAQVRTFSWPTINADNQMAIKNTTNPVQSFLGNMYTHIHSVISVLTS